MGSKHDAAAFHVDLPAAEQLAAQDAPSAVLAWQVGSSATRSGWRATPRAIAARLCVRHAGVLAAGVGITDAGTHSINQQQPNHAATATRPAQTSHAARAVRCFWSATRCATGPDRGDQEGRPRAAQQCGGHRAGRLVRSHGASALAAAAVYPVGTANVGLKCCRTQQQQQQQQQQHTDRAPAAAASPRCSTASR
jgi:hypothetical protein